MFEPQAFCHAVFLSVSDAQRHNRHIFWHDYYPESLFITSRHIAAFRLGSEERHGETERMNNYTAEETKKSGTEMFERKN